MCKVKKIIKKGKELKNNGKWVTEEIVADYIYKKQKNSK